MPTGAALQGAVFTLFVDNPPLGGRAARPRTPRRPTPARRAHGNCSITNIVPGRYWVVETTGVPGHDLAPDQNVIVAAGQTVSLNFVDPRKFKVIVLVCKESRQHALREHGDRRRRQKASRWGRRPTRPPCAHSAVPATRTSSGRSTQAT